MNRRILFPALGVGALALGAACALFGPAAFRLLVESRLRSWAQHRHYALSWRKCEVRWPPRITLERLVMVDRRPGAGAADTLLHAEHVAVELDAWGTLRGRIEPLSLEVRAARMQLSRRAEHTDSTAPRTATGDRVRSWLRSLDGLTAHKQRLSLHSILICPAPGTTSAWRSLILDSLVTPGDAHGAAMLAVGRLDGRISVPLSLELTRRGEATLAHLRVGGSLLEAGLPAECREVTCEWNHPDAPRHALVARVTGLAAQSAALAAGTVYAPLVEVRGDLLWDRARGEYGIADGAHWRWGDLAFQAGLQLRRDGPSVRGTLRGEGWSASAVRAALPAQVLGPLAKLPVDGNFDYDATLDADLGRPDDTRLDAHVHGRGLALGPGGGELCLDSLSLPFVAHIHLPHSVQVDRLMDERNPHFRLLHDMDPLLASTVVANEDGTFFQHHGVNPEALREALVRNLKRDRFSRGAGTLTMQLVRNLYLGHDKTLARKFQELVLAWCVEHLARVPKERLLEIYLNVVEWGPGLHGAEEACQFYLGHDPRHLTLVESAFLASLVPHPSTWARSFGQDGGLTPQARMRLHHIADLVRQRGELGSASLPAEEDFQITLSSAARAALTAPAVADSTDPESADPSIENSGEPSDPL